MADLEDFFAKRDKKKKKAPKFEADSVAKILEKKRVDMGKSSYQPSPSESAEPTSEYKAQEDDDEWREAVEHKPDYTGLKIQDLVAESSEDEENEAVVENGGQREGPWKRAGKGNEEEPLDTSAPVVEPPVKTVEPQKPKEEPIKESAPVAAAGNEPSAVDEGAKGSEDVVTVEVKPPPAPAVTKFVPPHLRNKPPANPAPAPAAPVAPVVPKPVVTATSAATPAPAPVGKFVPPHLRNQGANSASSSAGAQRPRKPTVAPNIDDKDFFPSL